MRHNDPLRSVISRPITTPATPLILKGLTYQVGDAFRNSRHFDLQLQGNDYPIVPWVALSNLSTQYENLYWAALVAPLRNSRSGKHEGCTYKPVWDGDLITGVSARIPPPPIRHRWRGDAPELKAHPVRAHLHARQGVHL